MLPRGKRTKKTFFASFLIETVFFLRGADLESTLCVSCALERLGGKQYTAAFLLISIILLDLFSLALWMNMV